MNEPTKLAPKERLAIAQQDMPSQPPQTRRNNMSEVALGYTPEMARTEASRCLDCPTKPCVAGCPVGVDIPAFVKKIECGDCAGALSVIKRTNLLPAICGRVCPQEQQCMKACTVGKMLKDPMKAVAIGRLERFAADCGSATPGSATPDSASPQIPDSAAAPVAVIGAGPASLAFAADMARAGRKVVIFEALHKPGGVLVYGIPEFRLPKKIVEAEIENLRSLGVEIRTNFVVGRSRPLSKLFEEDGFAAAFIGSGAGLPKFMGIPGENLVGVFSANEYLTRSNLMKAYTFGASEDGSADTPIVRGGKVAVFGGGNVAMDAARTALRLGAESVSLIYRRTVAEMPARAEEIWHAEEEGVEFRVLQNPTRILGDENDRVTGIECLRYELGEPDASGRRSPVPVAGSEFMLEADTVIVAIGNESNPLIAATTPEIKTDKRGRIIVDGNNETSMRNVFAGGDIVHGAATVILAMGEGRRAAAAVIKRLGAKQNS